MQNQMLRAIPFGKHQKMLAVISGDEIFLLFLVSSANLDVFCSRSFSHLVKFYRLIFMHKISSRVICVNGRHPRSFKNKKQMSVTPSNRSEKMQKKGKKTCEVDRKNFSESLNHYPPLLPSKYFHSSWSFREKLLTLK